MVFKDIERFVNLDLSKYGQDNPCPQSITIVNDDKFRHYELGSIIGFVVFSEDDGRFMISKIEEDDEYWFASEHPMYMHAGWVKEVNKTWQRMVKWIDDNLVIGWDKDSPDYGKAEAYRQEIKTELKNEIVPWPNGIAANNVLGFGADLTNNEK